MSKFALLGGDAFPDEIFLPFFTVFIFTYLLILGIMITMYVLQSLALFKIAKKRGIHNYGMAWVPIGSTWLLGKIADDVNLCRRNKKTNFARNILTLSLIYIAVFILFYIGAIFFAVTVAIQSETTGTSIIDYPATVLVVSLIALGMMVLAVVLSVLTYMALYRVFYGYDENNAVVFLVLSIFISYLLPIFLFIIRNRDLLPPDPSTFIQNGFPVYPNMYTPTPAVEENKFENNSNMEENTNE